MGKLDQFFVAAHGRVSRVCNDNGSDLVHISHKEIHMEPFF